MFTPCTCHRKVYNLVYNSLPNAHPEALIALDAEALAFDRVEWVYLFYSLEKFGFGKNFIAWFRQLCTLTQAMVRTNYTNSFFFFTPLYKTGLPLESAFICYCNRTLVNCLAVAPNIIGIMRYGVKLKLVLCADDLLLLLSNLLRSTQGAKSLWAEFCRLLFRIFFII